MVGTGHQITVGFVAMKLFDFLMPPSTLNADNFVVRAEQMRARLHDYPLMMIVAPAFIALGLVVLFWPVVSHTILLVWLGLMYASQLVEFYVWWSARAATRTLAECQLWHRRLVIFMTITGVFWGMAGVLFFVPNNVTYQFMLNSVLVGVISGAAVAHPMHSSSWRIGLVLAILPITLRNLLQGDVSHLIMAGMFACYFFYLLRGAGAWTRLLEKLTQHDAENRHLLEQLEFAKQRAEDSTLQKSRFLASASHDLRQPMQALTLFVEVLKMHQHAPQTHTIVEQIATSVDVLGDMFNSLLELSKLDSGGVQAYFTEFELEPLMQRMQAEFSVLAQQKNLGFNLSCAAAYVYSDAQLVERVLRNLLSNALRYTEVGEVSLSCSREANGIRIIISDSGIGIAPEHLAHIFEEYYQAENAHRQRSNGLGLGLAIVQRLDSLLDLHLQVKSVEREGSEFSFIVPYD